MQAAGEDELHARARAVRLAIFDVDGVMTDGTLYIGADGEAFKAFNILDGHGLKMLQGAGIVTAIISGRSSGAVARRAQELSIAHVFQGVGDKVAEYERLRARLGIEPAACLFMGDDFPDLGVMGRVGFAASVPNGADEVRAAAHYVTRAHGGRGAVREVCELVLRARAQSGAGPAA